MLSSADPLHPQHHSTPQFCARYPQPWDNPATVTSCKFPVMIWIALRKQSSFCMNTILSSIFICTYLPSKSVTLTRTRVSLWFWKWCGMDLLVDHLRNIVDIVDIAERGRFWQQASRFLVLRQCCFVCTRNVETSARSEALVAKLSCHRIYTRNVY